MYGSKAKAKTRELIENKSFEVEVVKKDKYNRNVTKITLEDGSDFASYMVSNGYAVVRYISPIKNNYFYYYDSNYINELNKLQEFAKENKIGFWAEPNYVLKKVFPK